MRYAHLGIPTKEEKKWSAYLPDLKVHISDPADSPFKIEWLKFEAGSPMPEIIRTTTHIAFEVDDLEKELQGREVLIPPFDASPTLRCAFIVQEGLAVELVQVLPEKPPACPCCS